MWVSTCGVGKLLRMATFSDSILTNMIVSLQSKSLWIETDVQNVAFCAKVNLISGDGVSVYLPLSLLVASSDFMRSLLLSSCITCGGVTRVSLPSVTGETLNLASQILQYGETEQMNKRKDIVTNSGSVAELLELLGCKAHLRIVCTKNGKNLLNGCVDGLRKSDVRGQVGPLGGSEKRRGNIVINISQEKSITGAEIMIGQQLPTEIKYENQNNEKLLLDKRVIKNGGNEVVVENTPITHKAEVTKDESGNDLEKRVKYLNSGGSGTSLHEGNTSNSTRTLLTSSNSNSGTSGFWSSGLSSQKKKTSHQNLEVRVKRTVITNIVKTVATEKKKNPVVVVKRLILRAA